MRALRIPLFASSEDIIKMAEKRLGKHKKFSFAQFPDNTVRLIILDNGTCNASQEDPDAL